MMQNDETGKKCCGFATAWGAIYWWAFLIVAVLAVPSIGFVFAALAPDQSLAQILVFIVTCWVSTFLGMKLMKK
jgi:hypothetical protein